MPLPRALCAITNVEANARRVVEGLTVLRDYVVKRTDVGVLNGGVLMAWKFTSKEKEMPLEHTQDSMLGDVFKIILAVILPPLGVFLEVGLGKHFWINIVLTLLGYVPGIIHAIYIIAKR